MFHMYFSLRLPLKRFRPEDRANLNDFESIITSTEHVYQHGQPTPPSPSQISLRVQISYYFIHFLNFFLSYFRVHMILKKMKIQHTEPVMQ